MLFSVIVPIYNVGQYLRPCIDSILSQTFSDFELILVDDGSLDDCSAICDEYAEKDKRVRAIHKKNGGLTSARKAGLNAASGEYVLCVDGDDYIDSNLLQKIADILNREKYDIVCFDYTTFPDKVGKTVISRYRAGAYDKKQIEVEIFPTLVTGDDGQRFPPSIWSKVFSRKLILPVQNHLPDDIIIGEDSCVSYVSVFLSDSLYIIYDELYHYRIDNASLTRNKKVFSWQEALKRMDFYLAYMPEDRFGEQIARITAHSFFNVAISMLRAKKYKQAKKDIKRMLSDERVVKVLENAKFKNSFKEKLALYCLKHKKIFLMRMISKVL